MGMLEDVFEHSLPGVVIGAVASAVLLPLVGGRAAAPANGASGRRRVNPLMKAAVRGYVSVTDRVKEYTAETRFRSDGGVLEDPGAGRTIALGSRALIACRRLTLPQLRELDVARPPRARSTPRSTILPLLEPHRATVAKPRSVSPPEPVLGFRGVAPVRDRRVVRYGPGRPDPTVT
jgi:hypothetical protein